MTDPVREAFEEWVRSQPFPNHDRVLERRAEDLEDTNVKKGDYKFLRLEYIAWQAAWKQSRREALMEAAALYCHYCANGTPIVQKEYGRNEPRWHDTGDGRTADCFATLIRAAAEEEGK